MILLTRLKKKLNQKKFKNTHHILSEKEWKSCSHNQSVNSSNRLLLSQNVSVKVGSNILVLAGGGTGVRHSLVKPNICNYDANQSFVLCDIYPQNILNSLEPDLLLHGYKINYIDLSDPETSRNHYNPFKYIYDIEDIQALSQCIIDNVFISLKYNRDSYIKLLNVVLGYTWFIKSQENSTANLSSAYKIISNYATCIKHEELFDKYPENDLKSLIENLTYDDDDNKNTIEVIDFIKSEWLSIESTELHEITIDLWKNLGVLILSDTQKLLAYDDLNLDSPNKAATFIGLSQSNTLHDFVASMMCMQLLRIKNRQDISNPTQLYICEASRVKIANEIENLQSPNIGMFIVTNDVNTFSQKTNSENVAIEDNFDAIIYMGSTNKSLVSKLSSITKLPFIYFFYMSLQDCFIYFIKNQLKIESKKIDDGWNGA